jgi:hypothetical protein
VTTCEWIQTAIIAALQLAVLALVVVKMTGWVTRGIGAVLAVSFSAVSVVLTLSDGDLRLETLPHALVALVGIAAMGWSSSRTWWQHLARVLAAVLLAFPMWYIWSMLLGWTDAVC